MYLCILHVKLDLVGGKIACNTAEILGRKTTHEKNVLMQDALNKHEIYALEINIKLKCLNNFLSFH